MAPPQVSSPAQLKKKNKKKKNNNNNNNNTKIIGKSHIFTVNHALVKPVNTVSTLRVFTVHCMSSGWFSGMSLRAGYQQISLSERDLARISTEHIEVKHLRLI